MKKKTGFLSLALSGVLAMNLWTPVLAEEQPEEKTRKEETVYAFLDWHGQRMAA